MIAADTSVVIAAFATWHEGHADSIRALEPGSRLPAHAAVESFSVLTRLPAPHRAPAGLVAEFLRLRFPEPFLTLTARAHSRLLREAHALGIAGGAIYDALVGATARRARAVLLTRDRRAVRVYEALGTRYRML